MQAARVLHVGVTRHAISSFFHSPPLLPDNIKRDSNSESLETFFRGFCFEMNRDEGRVYIIIVIIITISRPANYRM